MVGQLVIVLIDALRADFVLSADALRSLDVNYESPVRPKIPYLERKCQEHSDDALCFVTKVMPPTVTLPRIKALTTGGIPGFVDFVTNFDSAELKEDNLIDQWKRNGRSLLHFGDDTWIKLFPGR